MKKTFKILGIIALVVAIGFSMTACSDGSSTTSYPQPKQFIDVTGIPSAYNGMIGALRLKYPDTDKIIVYSTEEKISENSTTFPLFNWNDEKPWEGSGNFSITIIIFRNSTDAAAGTYIYAGVIGANTNIYGTTTTLPWS